MSFYKVNFFIMALTLNQLAYAYSFSDSLPPSAYSNIDREPPELALSDDSLEKTHFQTLPLNGIRLHIKYEGQDLYAYKAWMVKNRGCYLSDVENRVERQASTPYQPGIAVKGNYTVCAIGRDRAGNWTQEVLESSKIVVGPTHNTDYESDYRIPAFTLENLRDGDIFTQDNRWARPEGSCLYQGQIITISHPDYPNLSLSSARCDSNKRWYTNIFFNDIPDALAPVRLQFESFNNYNIKTRKIVSVIKDHSRKEVTFDGPLANSLDEEENDYYYINNHNRTTPITFYGSCLFEGRLLRLNTSVIHYSNGSEQQDVEIGQVFCSAGQWSIQMNPSGITYFANPHIQYTLNERDFSIDSPLHYRFDFEASKINLAPGSLTQTSLPTIPVDGVRLTLLFEQSLYEYKAWMVRDRDCRISDVVNRQARSITTLYQPGIITPGRYVVCAIGREKSGNWGTEVELYQSPSIYAGANRRPIINAAFNDVLGGVNVIVPLNYTDADGDLLNFETLEIINPPSKGNAFIAEASGPAPDYEDHNQLIYFPHLLAEGNDSLTIQIQDSRGAITQKTIDFTITPIIHEVSYLSKEGQLRSYSLAEEERSLLLPPYTDQLVANSSGLGALFFNDVTQFGIRATILSDNINCIEDLEFDLDPRYDYETSVIFQDLNPNREYSEVRILNRDITFSKIRDENGNFIPKTVFQDCLPKLRLSYDSTYGATRKSYPHYNSEISEDDLLSEVLVKFQQDFVVFERPSEEEMQQIPINVVNVRGQNGQSPASQDDLNYIVNKLNSYTRSNGISYSSFRANEYINLEPSNFYDLDQGEISQFLDFHHAPPGVLTIYIVGNILDGTVPTRTFRNGLPSNNTGPSFAISKTYLRNFDGVALAHEIGHQAGIKNTAGWVSDRDITYSSCGGETSGKYRVFSSANGNNQYEPDDNLMFFYIPGIDTRSFFTGGYGNAFKQILNCYWINWHFYLENQP